MTNPRHAVGRQGRTGRNPKRLAQLSGGWVAYYREVCSVPRRAGGGHHRDGVGLEALRVPPKVPWGSCKLMPRDRLQVAAARTLLGRREHPRRRGIPGEVDRLVSRRPAPSGSKLYYAGERRIMCQMRPLRLPDSRL